MSSCGSSVDLWVELNVWFFALTLPSSPPRLCCRAQEVSPASPEDGGLLSPLVSPEKKRGRPPAPPGSTSTKTKKTIEREAQQAKSAAAAVARQNFKQRLEDEARAARGPALRPRERGDGGDGAPARLPVEEELNPPKRGPGAWEAETIRLCLHIMHALKAERKEAAMVSTADPFARAVTYAGVSETTLRETWRRYEALRAVPPPLQNSRGFAARTHVGGVTKADMPLLRAEVQRMRLEDGHAVEVPDIQKWFVRVRGKHVPRRTLYYNLKRLGFVFGKTHKLCVHKESPRVTELRRQYLRNRMEWDKRIEARLAEAEHLAEGDEVVEGPRQRRLVYVYLDESYVNRNHSRGYTWYNEDDVTGAAVHAASGKGERLVMLTGITEEHGMFRVPGAEDPDLATLLLFQAKKSKGDYHKNMNGDVFMKWVEEQFFPALAANNLEGILVMDNASYHLTPAAGSVNPKSWTKKADATEFLDKYGIPYRAGKAPRGDSLVQLQAIAADWLEAHAEERGIMTGVTRLQYACKRWGHHVIFTPPYHPELQPIEELWRDVKMYVARNFAGTRSMAELREHVFTGFRKYGTREHTQSKVARVREWERKYTEEGVFADPIDLTELDADIDDDVIIDLRDPDVDDEDSDDEEEMDVMDAEEEND